MARYIHTLPIPTNPKSFYSTTLFAICVKGRSISHLLCSPKLTCTIQEPKEQASKSCNCRILAKKYHLPTMDGHVVVRHPKHARAMFGHQVSIVLQDIRNAVVPSWYETRSTFVRSVKRALHTLPVQTQSARHIMSSPVAIGPDDHMGMLGIVGRW